ncbi:MAG TPA: nitronate monooxygenase [Acidimicrobiales bacterium]|nr:nitronate monooxygenase [Acidimicrobiales bacterium]
MPLKTAFTGLLSIAHPVVCAPMMPEAGAALAAAVSNAGGLGLVAGGSGDPERLEPEIALLVERTTKPWGVGFITWAVTRQRIQQALGHRPPVVMLNFGDPSPYANLVHEAGSLLIVGVTDLEEARQAVAVGSDVIVAQGGEAGGHGGRRATLPFVPAVVDLVAPTPVLAAGGIADGRGLAAALVLGAAGALLGTRFLATPEALIAPWRAKAVVEGRGEETERGRVADLVREGGAEWPPKWAVRTIRNAAVEQWSGREKELEAELEANAVTREAYYRAAADGDPSVAAVLAGEAIDLITDIVPAAELVGRIVSQAEVALETAGHV